MKTKAIILGILIVIAASCSDEGSVQINVEEPFTDVMRFNSHEDFMTVTKKISTMTEEQLDAWEKENSFVSYRAVLNKAYKELETKTVPLSSE